MLDHSLLVCNFRCHGGQKKVEHQKCAKKKNEIIERAKGNISMKK